MNTVSVEDAKVVVNRVGERVGIGDWTFDPIYPEGRTDVCAVRRMLESDSNDACYNTIYFVWREPTGAIRYVLVESGRSTNSMIDLNAIAVRENGEVEVKLKHWDRDAFRGAVEYSVTVTLHEGQAHVVKEVPSEYRESAREAMLQVVQERYVNHPLYLQTEVKEFVVDEGRKLALFILFEQIDTDRSSPRTYGVLGDQFRYSLWMITGISKPMRFYEDHAYIRNSPCAPDGSVTSSGRNCVLKNVRLDGDTITVEHLTGVGAEALKSEDLSFNLNTITAV